MHTHNTHVTVPCTICPARNLVWLIEISLALLHQVLDDVEAALAGGNPEGSTPVLDGSPFDKHNRIY